MSLSPSSNRYHAFPPLARHSYQVRGAQQVSVGTALPGARADVKRVENINCRIESEKGGGHHSSKQI